MLSIRDSEEGFEPSQYAVAAPVFCQLHRGAREVARIFLELLFEFLEQGERIGRRTGEPSEQLPAAKGANFQCVRLHYCLTHGDLPVATERDLAIATHGEYGRGANALELTLHGFKLTGPA